jgi:hypothetical protein
LPPTHSLSPPIIPPHHPLFFLFLLFIPFFFVFIFPFIFFFLPFLFSIPLSLLFLALLPFLLVSSPSLFLFFLSPLVFLLLLLLLLLLFLFLFLLLRKGERLREYKLHTSINYKTCLRKRNPPFYITQCLSNTTLLILPQVPLITSFRSRSKIIRRDWKFQFLEKQEE